MKNYLILLLLGMGVSSLGQGAEPAPAAKAEKESGPLLHYQKGEISLQNGLAKLQLPEGYRYLPPADAELVLTKLWGNPPGMSTLGMIVPSKMSITDERSWAVVIEYQEDGYIKDADADKINYTKLLKQMQGATREANAERKKQGYHEVDLVGWAAPPRYDKETHKMYWAKELNFTGESHHTLNYGIRVLGRRGVLVLNTVASMEDFPLIEQQTPQIVKLAEFSPGNRYEDFNGGTDKVAAYGLAALVAGGVAAKAGFFKLLIAGLLAAKKLVIVVVIAAVAFFKKIFAGKGSSAPPSA